jgi:hypothetical protein
MPLVRQKVDEGGTSHHGTKTVMVPASELTVVRFDSRRTELDQLSVRDVCLDDPVVYRRGLLPWLVAVEVCVQLLPVDRAVRVPEAETLSMETSLTLRQASTMSL